MKVPKRVNFRKSFKGGGGVIFNPKLYIADNGPLYSALKRVFQKKSQYDFSNMRGGGQLPFGIFLKIDPFWLRHPSLMCINSLGGFLVIFI